MPVRIECFIGAWLTLPAADRTRLGASPRTAALGQHRPAGRAGVEPPAQVPHRGRPARPRRLPSPAARRPQLASADPDRAQLCRRHTDLGREPDPAARAGAADLPGPRGAARLDHVAEAAHTEPPPTRQTCFWMRAPTAWRVGSIRRRLPLPRTTACPTWSQPHDRNQPRRRCSASSTRSPTRRSRAPRCSASCGAIPYVELVHWLHQILQVQDSRPAPHHPPLRARRRRRLAADFTAALDRLPRGATSISDLSSHIEDAVERGWVFGTLMFGEVAGAHRPPAAGLPEDADPAQRAVRDQPRSSSKVKAEALADDFAKILANSPEAALGAADGSQRRRRSARRARPAGPWRRRRWASRRR